MTHNIIKTENYLLVVDDSEIKEGDWIYESDSNSVNIAGKGYHNFTQSDAKIIAHLPLNNSPVLEGVPLLPPLEDEVVELAQAYVINTPDNEPLRVYAFIDGYNKAKEKYKYTEEDIRFAIKSAFMQGVERVPYLHQLEDNIIKALQQPKIPVAFECEDEYVHDDTVPYPKTLGTHPKTVVNNQGQTVLVGKYIY